MKEKRNIIICILIFFVISILSLYNAKYLNSFYNNYYLKQTMWYLIGFIIIFLSYKVKFTNIFYYSKYLYIVNVILLIIVLFLGKTINGTKAWINLGLFSFQPSEFMKIILPLFFSYLTSFKEKKLKMVIKLIIYTLIPSILVFLEPDTGAIIFYLIILTVFLISVKINWKYYLLFFILSIIFIALFFLGYFYKREILLKIFGTNIFYRMDRFVNFKNNNYQLDLSLISIFAAPLIRIGLGKILIYIPEGATDFIFAFSVGNFGIIMALIIIFTYIIMIKNIIKLLKYSHNKKTNYLIISFIYMFALQIIINIAMNIGLLPIVGITLPFLSYGGSSMLVYFLFIALIFNLINNDKVQARSKNKNNYLLDDMD